MVSQSRELHGKAAAVFLRHRDLDQRRRPAGGELAPLDAPAGAVDVEEERLVRQTRRHEEPRRFSDGNRGVLDGEHGREGERRLLAADQKLLRHFENRAEVVHRAVVKAVGAGGQARNLERRLALRVVRQVSVRDLRAVLPEADHPLRRVIGVPAGPKSVPGGLEAFGGRASAPDEPRPRRHRGRLVGGKHRPVGLLEPRDAPRACPLARHAVEIRPHDPQPALPRLEQETRRRIDARLDGDEAEAEGARGRAGLAPLVGRVGLDAVRVREILRSLPQPLIRRRRENDLERPVGLKSATPAAIVCVRAAGFGVHHQGDHQKYCGVRVTRQRTEPLATGRPK